jgi:hypothetical protein
MAASSSRIAIDCKRAAIGRSYEEQQSGRLCYFDHAPAQ